MDSILFVVCATCKGERLLTYRVQNGAREVIHVPQDLENNVMEIFMGYLDRVVTYAFGEEQAQNNRERHAFKGPMSTNRPGPQTSLRQLEHELAVDFLARRMAPRLQE